MIPILKKISDKINFLNRKNSPSSNKTKKIKSQVEISHNNLVNSKLTIHTGDKIINTELSKEDRTKIR